MPSPGNDRDYILYVGFDVGEWDPMRGEVAPIAAVEAPPPPPVDAAAGRTAAAASHSSRTYLPTPTDGFVLPVVVQRPD